MPICKKSATTITIECNNEKYISKITKVEEMGWRRVRKEGLLSGDFSSNVGNESSKAWTPKNTTVHQRVTRPKAIHTESSLLSAMENASKDMGVIDGLMELGLGTPATRASTIETLISRGYVIREGRSLVPTPKGLVVYDTVRDMRIANVQLTREWENGLCSIEKGELDSETFGNVSREYTRQITTELLAKQVIITSGSNLCCPKCGEKSITIFDKIAKCKNGECNFIVFRDIAGKRLSEKQVEELITNGKTALIKGFKSNVGVSFDAALLLDDSHKTTFQFPKRKKSDKRGSQKLK